MNWLILIHQIPAKPTYFRAKILRRLNKVGAVPIKQAVYVMPDSEQSHEDLGWIAGEITESGGEAVLLRGELIEGLKNDEVVELFQKARSVDYDTIFSEARGLKKKFNTGELIDSVISNYRAELTRLKKSFSGISTIDFFPTNEKKRLENFLNDIELMIHNQGDTPVAGNQIGHCNLHGKTWITRNNVYVDRMASAWFIRRFIDPEAMFKFTGENRYIPETNELRFDMTEAEYTHQGALCTLEVLVRTFCPADTELQKIAKIIHDIDLKDNDFGLPETAGIHALFDSIVLINNDDTKRIEQAGNILDSLLVTFKNKKN